MKNCVRAIWKKLLPALAVVVLASGCSLLPRPSRAPGDRAFIAYWPPPENSTQLKLAVKDNINMKGVVTTAGSAYFAKNARPASKDAACLAIARQRNVVLVGKTNLSEFAVYPSGINEHFGTPKSPLRSRRGVIPGGSSSGLADVAFGTDTAGSVRVPAACCGIVGLKTTHGLISLEGIHPVEPQHLDTVGPLAKDIAQTVVGMDLLQSGFASRYAAVKAAKPSAAKIRIGRLSLKGTNARVDRAVDEALAAAGFQVIPLSGEFHEKWEQAMKDGNLLAAAGTWKSNWKHHLSPGVSARTRSVITVGRISYRQGYRQAVARQAAWQKTLKKVFRNVDFIALPTLQGTPLVLPTDLNTGIIEAVVLGQQNTAAVNFAGNPALALPIPLRHSIVPVTSLQLIGPRKSEVELLNAGRLVENAVKKK